MAAAKNNNYHGVWNEEKALKLFKDSLELLQSDETIKFIGVLANKLNTYRQIYKYLLDEYGKDNKDFDTIKKLIDSIIETRLYDEALNNRVNSTMAIFGLKNNHDWKDKTEVEVDQKQNIVFQNLSKEFDIDQNGESNEK